MRRIKIAQSAELFKRTKGRFEYYKQGPRISFLIASKVCTPNGVIDSTVLPLSLSQTRSKSPLRALSVQAPLPRFLCLPTARRAARLKRFPNVRFVSQIPELHSGVGNQFDLFLSKSFLTSE